MAEKPVAFKKGTKVEVVLARTNASHDYVGEHDGAEGTVETFPVGMDHTKAIVRLKGEVTTRKFPTKALKEKD